MYEVLLVPSPARLAALWVLQDPGEEVLASTDQGYSHRQLTDYCGRLNALRRRALSG